MNEKLSPLDLARAVTPEWLLRIREFGALEIHPCAVVGHDSTGADILSPCEPEDAAVWTVYGHYRTGGTDDFADFATEAEAIAFHDRLISIYPHLAGEGADA
jgi:hypothetical protein